MEPSFVCEFAPTVKMIAARARRFSPGRCAVMAIVGIGFAAFVIPGCLWYRLEGVWALYFLLALVWPLYGIFWPEIAGWFSLRRFRKDTDGEGVYRVAFGDVIEVRQGQIRVTWEYSEITRVERLKYSYELIKNKRLTIMVVPACFTKGTFEEFKQFLREKRPDLYIPD